MSRPSSAKRKKKDGENEEEESELIQNSSDEEADEDAELASVSCTPLMKPVITDRSRVHTLTQTVSNTKESQKSLFFFFFLHKHRILCFFCTGIISTCHTLKRNRVCTSKAGGRTRGGGSTTPT